MLTTPIFKAATPALVTSMPTRCLLILPMVILHFNHLLHVLMQEIQIHPDPDGFVSDMGAFPYQMIDLSIPIYFSEYVKGHRKINI